MDSNFPYCNNSNKNKILNSKYCSDISKINSQLESENGNTPLILSLLSKDIESFTELLSLGISPNISNYSGDTPLHISVSNNYKDFIILLLKNNADCNIQNNQGNTPLHLALENKESNIIQILLKNNINPNIKNNLGLTPMHLAIINKVDEGILKCLKNKGGDIYNIKDNFNKSGFDYAKNIGDIFYENLLIKIFGKCNKTNLLEKFGHTLKETNLSNILNEINNNSQSSNYQKITNKYYLDNLLNNHSEKTLNKYNIQSNEINDHNRINSDSNNKDIKLEDFNNNQKDEKKESINKKYTHGRSMQCSDLNSNNIQIKELDNSSENDSEKFRKSSSGFLAEEVNNLDINDYKDNKDIVGINDNNKNINISRIYSQKSENSVLSKIMEINNENSKINSNLPFSNSSIRNISHTSNKSNISNNQNLYQSNSFNTNKKIIKTIITDTVKKIKVNSITSSEGENLSNLNILSKDNETNSNKNNEFNMNSNTDNNCNFYENGTNSFVIYKNKNLNELYNKEIKNIKISNINEEINLITKTDKTNKTNKTDEYNQNNNLNINKTIILSTVNFPNSSIKENMSIQESFLEQKNKDMKDNNFINSDNSHILSDLNANTNNFNNVSLSYSKNLKSNDMTKTHNKASENNENKNSIIIKNINTSNNNSLNGSNYSNNTKKIRISNGNPNSLKRIKKSKSIIYTTSAKKSNTNKSIYNKQEIENFNKKNKENLDSKENNNKLENNLNNDRKYQKHHRQLSYHINYKSGLNNNKNKEFKRNNTKNVISNIKILETSNKNDNIYLNKNNLALYSYSKKSDNSENKKDNNNNTYNNQNKESLKGINKSIKSLVSTNNQNNSINRNINNIFSNSIKKKDNNIYNLKLNTKKNRTKKIIKSNRILSGNTTQFSTINKNNRLSKINHDNNNIVNIPKTTINSNSIDDIIIYNDYDEEDDDNASYGLRNISTSVLLRLREFLLSCDLLCYYNLLIEKKMYKIDSYINNIQKGISSLTYDDFEKIGIKKPGHIFRILIKLEIDAGIIDNNLFNFILERVYYSSLTTTTLVLTSSVSDINCCGINIYSNNYNYKNNKKSKRNPNLNFTDLSSFLSSNNLTKYKGNFIFNGFEKIEYVLIQMFSKYSFDQKMLSDYLHIYINRDKIKLLNILYEIKSCISKEFGMEIDYNEYNKVTENKLKQNLKDEINKSDISNNNKKSLKSSMSYINKINNSHFIDSNSVKNSDNYNNDKNSDNSNDQNLFHNNCIIF